MIASMSMFLFREHFYANPEEMETHYSSLSGTGTDDTKRLRPSGSGAGSRPLDGEENACNTDMVTLSLIHI